MKLIIAILRITKMNETKAALSEVGLPSFTAMPILGRGKGRGSGPDIDLSPSDAVEYKSTYAMPRLKSKRMITLVVTDEKKELAVETILKINQTGNCGDGKIFVMNAVDSIRVRTGETGDLTLD